jgi:hypothetical protein
MRSTTLGALTDERPLATRSRLVPSCQARKQHNHAVSSHEPARTRTWDQSIMRKGWLVVAVERNVAWMLGFAVLG